MGAAQLILYYQLDKNYIKYRYICKGKILNECECREGPVLQLGKTMQNRTKISAKGRNFGAASLLRFELISEINSSLRAKRSNLLANGSPPARQPRHSRPKTTGGGSCVFATRYDIKTPRCWLSRTACAWKKYLDGGLPSHQLGNLLQTGKILVRENFACLPKRTNLNKFFCKMAL
jgi:hypothetical protein